MHSGVFIYYNWVLCCVGRGSNSSSSSSSNRGSFHLWCVDDFRFCCCSDGIPLSLFDLCVKLDVVVAGNILEIVIAVC